MVWKSEERFALAWFWGLYRKSSAEPGAVSSAVKGLNEGWEQALADKERGQAEFGTNLGRLHEYTLVLLSKRLPDDHILRPANKSQGVDACCCPEYATTVRGPFV